MTDQGATKSGVIAADQVVCGDRSWRDRRALADGNDHDANGPLSSTVSTTIKLGCQVVVVVADEVLATAAAAKLGLIRSDAWPMVAAHLLAQGHDGADLLTLACLGTRSSGWQVDHLVPGTLRDLGAPALSVEATGDIAARLLAQAAPAISGYPLVRLLDSPRSSTIPAK